VIPDLHADAPVEISTHDDVAQLLAPSGAVVTATVEAGNRPVLDASLARAALSRPVSLDRRLGDEHEHVRLLARRVSVGRSPRIAVVATSLEPTDDAVGRVRDGLLVGGGLAVVLAGVGGWFLASAALRPVERMRREAAEISTGDTASRLGVPDTRDELASLALTINELLGRLQGALSRHRSFVANAGHELRTPLAILRTELELAGRRPRSEAELRDVLEHAADESERLSNLVEELLFLAAADDEAGRTPYEPIPVATPVTEACDSVRASLAASGVHLTTDADPDVWACVAPGLLRRAVENLVENALRYAPTESTIAVRVRRDGTDAVITVTDQGPGFPDEFLARAFDRFSRADEARSRAQGGTGLGLAIVGAVARAHGGTASVANRPGGGAVAMVRVPRSM
jgi:heavy metal sensor kinase